MEELGIQILVGARGPHNTAVIVPAVGRDQAGNVTLYPSIRLLVGEVVSAYMIAVENETAARRKAIPEGNTLGILAAHCYLDNAADLLAGLINFTDKGIPPELLARAKQMREDAYEPAVLSPEPIRPNVYDFGGEG